MKNSDDSELLFEAYKQVINELTKNRIVDAIYRTPDDSEYNKERISRVQQKLKTYNRDLDSSRDIKVIHRGRPTKFHLRYAEESHGVIAINAVSEDGEKVYFCERNKDGRSSLWVSSEPWSHWLDDFEVIFVTRGDALKVFNLIKWYEPLQAPRWSPPVQKFNILPTSTYNNLKLQGDI